ncbi:cryptochrome/photolyase family protein [Roseobacteraceae bacterium NS-SX3]
MTAQSPVIWWVRRDLRLADNPALAAAVSGGRPVIPVFILDGQEEDLGAAPKFRLGLGLSHFACVLEGKGSQLILRRGDALMQLRALIGETGAQAVYWSRLYDPDAIARDSAVKTALKEQGCDVRSFGGRLLFEPWTVETKAGGMYRVYTPFWKAVRSRDVGSLSAEPGRIPVPDAWPESEKLSDWAMAAAMRRGAEVVQPYCRVGESAALERLEAFIEEKAAGYKKRRDFPAENATSGLSENLAWGEISPHRLWHLGRRAQDEGNPGAEHFLKEVVWREFAYHLMYHTPEILGRNWRLEWNRFPWQEQETEKVLAWKQGRTGYGFVDAAMREMYVTGTMHNRARMIVASFLCKHLMTHWKIGRDWFAECLVDWDPAANALGWQWVAGSGPDAAPFFRIFNPEGQLEKFDPKGGYVQRWVAEGQAKPPQTALDYFDAVPRAWGLSPDLSPAERLVDLRTGRERALAAYEAHRTAG